VSSENMIFRNRFHEIVSSEVELRDIIGRPSYWFQSRIITRFDARCRRFIASSPFAIIASTGAAGKVDVSPKGDPPGFVRVLDDTTLAIPDRAGNRRCDTLQNIFGNPDVGLILFVPGKGETLRVSGKAIVVRDLAVREPMAQNGRLPELAIVVALERAFFHCSTCIRRSKLWAAATSPNVEDAPALADLTAASEALDDEGRPPAPLERTPVR
jgi:PPOX class probable FMN-dependent enzyme